MPVAVPLARGLPAWRVRLARVRSTIERSIAVRSVAVRLARVRAQKPTIDGEMYGRMTRLRGTAATPPCLSTQGLEQRTRQSKEQKAALGS